MAQSAEEIRLKRMIARNGSALMKLEIDVKTLKAKIKGLNNYIQVLKDAITKDSQREAFEMFAELHPIEAFDLDKERFCDYVRKKTKNPLSDAQIFNLINIL